MNLKFMNKLVDLDFWNRKKVLITGHTGFKGSWMSAIMKQLNAEIYGLSNIQKKGIYEAISKEEIFQEEFFADINNINEDLHQKLISIEIDNFVEIKIKETDPGLKGDTATNTFKLAILENGLEIKVPLFISPGDYISVDTRNTEYQGRANK